MNTGLLLADGLSYHECSIANISTGVIKSVKIEVISGGGSVLNATEYNQMQPGVSGSVTYNVTSYARCRFTVNGASAAKVRANLTVYHSVASGGDNYMDILGTEIAR